MYKDHFKEQLDLYPSPTKVFYIIRTANTSVEIKSIPDDELDSLTNLRFVGMSGVMPCFEPQVTDGWESASEVLDVILTDGQTPDKILKWAQEIPHDPTI